MNPEDSPKRKEQQSSPLRRFIIITLAVAAIAAYLFSMNSANVDVQDATLPDIVSAVEAGEVETLTVRGDTLIAAKTDGSRLSTRKESNISTVEALQLLGVPAESLKALPIVVEEPGIGLGGAFTLLFTFAPLLLIGFIIFQVTRQMRGGGSAFGLPGNVGRSNPRVISRTAAGTKEEDIERPVVTFDDVAGAEQAKLELLEVVEF